MRKRVNAMSLLHRPRRLVVTIACGALAVALSGPLAAGSVADLSVTKEGNDPVAPGTVQAYVIRVTNDGPAAASNVHLLDAVPAGTTFLSFNAPAGWTVTAPAPGGTGTVDAANPSLPLGTAQLQMQVLVDATTPSGATITNTATVSSDTTDPDSADLVATETTTVIPHADLAAFKMANPDPAVAASDLTYTIFFTNNGPNDAINAELLEATPAGTTFVSFAAPAGWTVNGPAVGGTGAVEARRAVFPPGPAVFTFVVNVNPATPAGALITNTAAVRSDTLDVVTGNDVHVVTTPVVLGAAVIPALSATGALALLVLLGCAATILLRRGG